MKPESGKGACREKLKLYKAVNPDVSAQRDVRAQPQEYDIGKRYRDYANEDDRASTSETNDRRDGEVELFFYGKAPKWIDWAHKSMTNDVEISKQEGEGKQGVPTHVKAFKPMEPKEIISK